MTVGCPQVTLKETLRSCYTSKGLGGLVWLHTHKQTNKQTVSHTLLITLVTFSKWNVWLFIKHIEETFLLADALTSIRMRFICSCDPGSCWLAFGYRCLQWVDEWGRLLFKWKEHTRHSPPADSCSRGAGGCCSMLLIFFFSFVYTKKMEVYMVAI